MRSMLRIAAMGVTVVALMALAGPALATHTHAKATGRDGVCVVLAANGGEMGVNLPASAFNKNTTVTPTEDRNHPLHVLAHKGKPGSDGGYWVYGTESDANCTSYVNVRS